MDDTGQQLDFEQFREAGRQATGLLSGLVASLRVGETTGEAARCAESLLPSFGLRPAAGPTAGNQPAGPWISLNINETVCHAIPGGRIMRAGDLIVVDVAVLSQGPNPVAIDLARPVLLGRRPDGANEGPRRALAHAAVAVNRAALNAMQPGGRWSDAAAAARSAAAGLGFRLVRGFPGHGIGRRLHQAPVVGYHGEQDFVLAPGLAVTLEPILTPAPPAGDDRAGPDRFETVTLSDGWTTASADGAETAFAEWTVLMTERGPEVIAG